jgi:hypothetical protein
MATPFWTDRFNVPPIYWLLTLLFVASLANLLSVESLNWKTSYEMIYNHVPDISPILQFHFDLNGSRSERSSG